MQNFLVCFYAEGSMDISHRVLVNGANQSGVTDQARGYFIGRNTPQHELASFTVESYEQGRIEAVEII